jgi:hypothetical protein
MKNAAQQIEEFLEDCGISLDAESRPDVEKLAATIQAANGELVTECLRLAALVYPNCDVIILNRTLGVIRQGSPKHVYNAGRYFLYAEDDGHHNPSAKFAANDLETLLGDVRATCEANGIQT